MLRDAQKAAGLTNEDMARLLGLKTERTWRRWVERGQVPVGRIEDVAGLLNLRVERPGPVTVTADPNADLRRVVREELSKSQADVDELLRRVARLLAELEDRQDDPEGRSTT